MQLNIHYSTSYRYAPAARSVTQLLRVTPVSFAGQTVLDWRIDVNCDAQLREGRDGYGNTTHMLYIGKPIEELVVAVAGRVLTEDRHGSVQALPHDLPPQVFLRETPLSAPGPAIAALAAKVAAGKSGALDRLHRLAACLHQDMRFDTEATVVETKAEQAAAEGHGVCQDFTHIFIAAARALGIPARYVSGHLYRRDGQHAQEAGHAWAEGWVEHLGWVAFDPVNGISADDAYVRVACGLDYRDAAPVAGVHAGGGGEEMAVEVRVGDAARQSQSQSQSQS
jgi:transglutaminase-like putative cysteine protease